MKFAAALAVVPVLASSLLCRIVSANDEPPEADEGEDALTIFDIVAESPDHTSLAILIEGALPAIVEALTNSNSTLTLFAPDDTALSALDPEAFTLLLSEPWIQQLSCVLLAHVYGDGVISSTDVMATEGNMTVESLLPGFELTLAAAAAGSGNETTTGGMTVNDIEVTRGDVNATNGIVHSIAQVLLPDCVTQDLYAVLSSNPLFSTLVTLVASANLTEALSAPPTENGLTILAPSVDAFSKVPADVLAYLVANPEALMQVIQYHIIPSNYDGSVLGELETMLEGETIDVSIVENGDGTLVLNGNATVTSANILASNGIIHEIDSVLLPPSFNMSAGSATEPTPEPTDITTNATEAPTPEPDDGTTNTTTAAPTDTNTTTSMPTGETTNATMSPAVPALASLLDIVSSSEAHATLATAVGAVAATVDGGSNTTKSSAIADLLSDETKTLTVFAPNEDAFATLAGDGTLERLLTEPWKGHLECVLLAHVHDGDAAVLSSDITEATTVDSLSPGYELDIEPGDPLTVNGLAIDTPDIPAMNGVLHSLADGVLLPPCVTDDIVAILSAREDFAQLVTLASATQMVSALSSLPGASGLTILAPSNAALGKLDSVVLAGLAASNMDALVDILEYHIIEENWDGSTTGSVTTKLGEVIQVTRDADSGVLMINGAKVLEENILASNGVIHVIDTVLIPPSLADTPGLPDTTSSGTDNGDGDDSGAQEETPVGGDGSSGASRNMVFLSSALVAAVIAGFAALVL